MMPSNYRTGLLCCVVAATALAAAAAARDYPRYRTGASTFVPLDNWIYPTLERLAALGYVKTAMLGMKPWTRIECARLTEEAGDAIQQSLFEDSQPDGLAVRQHAALEHEFAFELDVLAGGTTRSAQTESIYARALSISGPPLTDGFHFGQTVSYDFGRPFRQGTNAIAGASARATAGPVAIYVHGEYQHAPSAPRLPDGALDIIALRDGVPRPAAAPFEAVDRFRLLEGYVSFNVRSWQLLVGRQSFSWGPSEGSLLLSNNAEPLLVIQLTRVLPMRLPGYLRRLGPIRIDNFVSRSEGHTFIPRPFLIGQKVSFKPTPYLEFGIGRVIQLGGRGGIPFTVGNFARSYFGVESGGTVPGDNRAELDFSLMIPGLDNYLTLYVDGFAEDDHIPYSHPARSVFRPGIHLTRFPGIQGLDLRVEAATSESPGIGFGPGFNYWNFQYRDGHTNNGFLMGNTVGRQGRTIRFSSTRWHSPGNILQFHFKHSQVSGEFVPGGASWQDYGVRHEVHLRSGLYVKTSFQIEHIRHFAVLFPGSRRNTMLALEIGLVSKTR